jgi:2,4-dienoyl-CoA reductase-like NADH-dependent reductase (Old Yellow Enzyme family)
MKYRRIAQLRTAEQFREYCEQIGTELPFDETIETGNDAPLAQSFKYKDKILANRFSVLPMEGWDGTTEGHPSDLTRRRWQHFGQSGAPLIWGGEAVAVRHDGRANYRQLVINEKTLSDIAGLRDLLIEAHETHHGSNDLLIGLQLTHSGRFCRPNSKALEPRVAYRHPLLDKKFNIDNDSFLLSDSDIDRLIEDFGKAAKLAQKAGFDFVDIKHCHGYLGHEFLTALNRDGKYGGSFENRTRFLRNIVEAVRAEAPDLDIGVRLSAFDWIPFRPDTENSGEPETYPNADYPFAFGADHTGLALDLSEPKQFLDLLLELDIHLVCITGGSPYYTPHLIRPATFPPSDGYQPPEDPLLGVARHIHVTSELKKHRPELLMVGSGYSYLQDWIPNVAQRVIRDHRTDFVGLGRMMLSYPEMPSDILAGNELQRKRICRTFSDCTTAPRNGIVSGCYPLDPFYKARKEFQQLQEVKKK